MNLKSLGIAFTLGLIASFPVQAAETAPDSNKSENIDPPSGTGSSFSMFTQLDQNSDGYIDKNEATRSGQVKADFDNADTNGDKNISRTEWNTYRNIKDR